MSIFEDVFSIISEHIFNRARPEAVLKVFIYKAYQ